MSWNRILFQMVLYRFSNASKKIYAFIVYAVLPEISSVLLAVETREASIKNQTFPRLKLHEITLLVRLSKYLIEGMTQHAKANLLRPVTELVLIPPDNDANLIYSHCASLSKHLQFL